MPERRRVKAIVARALTVQWHTPCFLTLSNFLWRMRCFGLSFSFLVVLWMLGVVSSYTLGGFIHVLLVLAIVALLVQLIQGRRVV